MNNENIMLWDISFWKSNKQIAFHLQIFTRLYRKTFGARSLVYVDSCFVLSFFETIRIEELPFPGRHSKTVSFHLCGTDNTQRKKQKYIWRALLFSLQRCFIRACYRMQLLADTSVDRESTISVHGRTKFFTICDTIFYSNVFYQNIIPASMSFWS